MTTSDQLRDAAAAGAALLNRRAEQSLGLYVRLAWPILEPGRPMLPNWHIDCLVEHLEAVSAGDLRQLVINVPPRYMKSLLVSVLWPTWEWIQRPTGRWIFASHTESLAAKHSLDRRTVIQSDWYQSNWRQRVQLADDLNLRNEFQNAQRGVMIATSIGGTITGKGGDRIVIDDPHNPLEVESDVQREAVLEYFRRSLSTRLDDKARGAIVLVMQRLHEGDLSAFCRDQGFQLLSLPVEAETRTTIVFPRSQRAMIREIGDVLWPARETREQLANQKRLLGSAAYEGQYQQRPAPAGGAIFKREWLKFYDDLPPNVKTFAQSWDCTFKGGSDADYVVGLVAGRHGPNVFLVDRVKGQWDFADTLRQVEHLSHSYPKARAKYIEETANGAAIISVLKNRVSGVIGVQPQGGKESRAYAVQALVEAGNLFLPNPCPGGQLRSDRAWVEDFIHELLVFPHGRHDDDVDALTQLLIKWQEPVIVPSIRSLG